MGAGKLTTIVAVDVDGFSAMAEADEAGAIAAVARLANAAPRSPPNTAGASLTPPATP